MQWDWHFTKVTITCPAKTGVKIKQLRKIHKRGKLHVQIVLQIVFYEMLYMKAKVKIHHSAEGQLKKSNVPEVSDGFFRVF